MQLTLSGLGWVLCCSLLLLSASLVVESAPVRTQGLTPAGPHLIRAQSNAKPNPNANVKRILKTETKDDDFIVKSISISRSNESAVVEALIVRLSLLPFPRIAITKREKFFKNASDHGEFTMQKKAMAIVYPMYTQRVVGSEEVTLKSLVGLEWHPFDVTNTVDSGVQLLTVTACSDKEENNTETVCFGFQMTNDTLSESSSEVIFVDSIQILTQLPIDGADSEDIHEEFEVALISNLFYTKDSSAQQLYSSRVDKAVAEAQSRYGSADAVTPPDFVVQFKDSVDSGYINWDRQAIATRPDGSRTGISLTVQVDPYNGLDAEYNLTQVGFNTSDDQALKFMSQGQYIIYKFNVPKDAQLNSLTYHREAGVAQVDLDTSVDGGWSLALIAGIAALALAAVLLFGGVIFYHVRKYKRNSYASIP